MLIRSVPFTGLTLRNDVRNVLQTVCRATGATQHLSLGCDLYIDHGLCLLIRSASITVVVMFKGALQLLMNRYG